MARNPLKTDPTRTTALRGRFVGGMNRRINALKAAVRNIIIKLDVFGLKAKKVPLLLNVEARAWAFVTDDEKINRFREWLKEQTDAGILSVDSNTGQPWTNEFVQSAHRQGIVRAHTDARALAKAAGEIDDDVFFAGGQDEFLRSAFGAPETTSKLKLLQTRAFENLKGVSQQMSADMGRILADGLAAGLNPEAIARTLTNRIDTLNRARARTIARTEIIHAHAEGQLDSFERLGIEEVGVLAEWETAGDDRVCPQCSSMEGVVLSIKEARAMIPRHPNCRCAWTPAETDIKIPGQKRSKAEIDTAIKKSLKVARPTVGRGRNKRKTTAKEQRDLSVWVGKDAKIGKERPENDDDE